MRYQSNISNPEKHGKNKIKGLNVYEGGVLEPWRQESGDLE